jgi:hypothetical protein
MTAHTYMVRLFSLISLFFLVTSVAYAQYMPFSFRNPLFQNVGTTNTYYVAANGNDNNDGLTALSPFQTTSKINSIDLLPGDSVKFRAGDTFDGGIRKVLTYDNTGFPLVFTSYGGGRAKIRLSVSDTNGIYIEYPGHIKVHIDNLDIEGRYVPTNESGGQANSIGVYINSNTLITPLESNGYSFVDVKNCLIHNVDLVGIAVYAENFGKTIITNIYNNQIYDIGIYGVSIENNWHSNSIIQNNTIKQIYGKISSDPRGIYLAGCKNIDVVQNNIHNIGQRHANGGTGIIISGSRSITIKKNEIHNIHATADRTAIRVVGSDSTVIDGNYIYNNQSYGVYMLSQQSSAFPYIATDYINERGGLDSGASRHNNITNNIFKNNALSGTAVIRINGVSTDNKANYISIFNNTIVNSKTPNQKKGIYLDAYFNNTKVLNNIILSDSGLTHFLFYNLTGVYSVVTSPLVSENNLFWDRGLRGVNFAINNVTKNIDQLNNEYSFELSRLLYNPFLKAPFTTNDSLNNVDGFDTLTMYQPLLVSANLDNGWDITNDAFVTPTEDFYGNQRLNIAYDIGAFENTTSTYRYQPELVRWFGRDTTQPVVSDTYSYDSLVLRLKADNIYQKLDLVYILAAPTALLSRNQLTKDTFDLITPNPPGFTPYVGYTGNGSNTYLNTQWIPGVNNTQYQLNSSHYAVKTHLNLDENTVVLGTYAPTSLYNMWFRPKYNSQVTGTLNDAVFTPQSNTNAKGFYAVNRSTSNSKLYYKDGAQLGTSIQATTNTLVTNRPLYLLALNADGGISAPSNNKISFVGVGASLTPEEHVKYAQHVNRLVNSFSVVDPPEIATLLSPSNNSTGIEIDTSFNWSGSPSADSFRIEVSTDSLFTAPITRTVTVPPSALTSNLAYNTTYYWRVIAINTVGTTPSSKFKFTTTSPNLVYTNTPQNMQLYARGVDDSASVTVSGSITTPSLDSLYIELYKSNVLTKRFSQALVYTGQTAGFSQVARLATGLHNYKFLVYTKRGAVTYLNRTVDSIVVGDAYIVMGQSNAWSGGNGTYTYSDQFCRTFGVQTPNGNGDPYLIKDTLWTRSSAAFNTEPAPNGNYPNNVGVWALQLQRMIRDTFGIPTVIINGAKHTARIAEHIRDDNTPTNLNTYYGKVLYRTQKAGLVNAIKGIFWYQGELNTDTSYQSYLSYFSILRTDWLLDYPNINQIFVFQPRPGCGFDQHDKLRERIRQIPGLYADAQVMSTIGFYNYNACHFFVDGYIDIGRSVFRNVGQKYYGGTDTINSKSPNIRKAYFTNQLKTQIRLLFNNSNVSSWPADTLGKRIKDYIYLDGVALGDTISSGSVSGDTVIINLTIPRNATTISYTPPLLDRGGAYFKWPVFKNSRGLAALTFHNYPVDQPQNIFLQESIDLFTRMTTVSDSRKYTIDSLIRKYKSHNVWGGDVLYIFANSDTSAANLNWYSTNYTARRVSNPTFTVDRGYTFNGVNSYLNSQYRPNISAITYTIDSGSFAVYSRIDTDYDINRRFFGAWTPLPVDSTYIGITPKVNWGGRRIFTNMTDKAGSLNIYNNDARGLFLANRLTKDTVKIYRSDVLLGTNTTQKSGKLTQTNLYIGAYNTNGVAGYFYNGELSMFRIGNKYTSQQVSDFTKDTEWYLNRVGALVSVSPYVANLLSPANDAINVSQSPTFTWDTVSNANTYTIEYSAVDSTLQTSTTLRGPLSVPSGSPLIALNAGVKYWWRIWSVNSYDTTFSSIRSFTTSSTTPVLAYPNNTQIGIAHQPIFDWQDLVGANYYHIQLGLDDNFVGLIFEDTNVVTSTDTLITDTLLSNSTYYWRVRGNLSPGVWSTYSPIWSFTTTTWQFESITLFARMTATATTPSDNRKLTIDTLIKKLKSDTIFQKLDLFYVMAATDTGQANINWVTPSAYRLLRFSGLTFTTDEGYKGNGTSGYMKTQWIPSVNAVNYQLNSASVGTYVRNEVLDGGPIVGATSGGNYIYHQPKASANSTFRILLNDAGFTAPNASSTLGMYSGSRVSSTSVVPSINGVVRNALTKTSTAVPTSMVNLFVNSISNTGTTSGSFDSSQISMVFLGGALTNRQQEKFFDHFHDYMVSIGKNVLESPNVYYIDSIAGNDLNDGLSVDYPWKTLQRVQSQVLREGDTVKFKAPGNYSGTLSKTNSEIRNVTFTSYGSGRPVLSTTTGGSLFSLTSTNTLGTKIHISNLKLVGKMQDSANYLDKNNLFWAGINYLGSDTGTTTDSVKITIKNCDISNFGTAISLVNRYLDKPVKYVVDSNIIYNSASGVSTSGGHDSSVYKNNIVYNIYGHDEWEFAFGIVAYLTRNAVFRNNLVYNVGKNASQGSVGIGVSGSSKCLIEYNEVYGAKTTLVDGDGLDLDWNSDSCLVQYNYLHNNAGAGLLISGHGYNWFNAANGRLDTSQFGYNWFFADSSQSSYNTVRYNIFKNNGREINYGAITFYAEATSPTLRMKSNNIYNNTFIQSNVAGLTNESFIKFIPGGVGSGLDSTRIYNNIFLGDSLYYFYSPTNITHFGTRIENNLYWDSLNIYRVFWAGSGQTFSTWRTAYTQESNPWLYKPFLQNSFAARDTLNNVTVLDTLTAYKKMYYPSTITNNGVNFDSLFAYALLSQPTRGTTDYYGTALAVNGRYDIGAYEDTSAYIWQDTTTRFFGSVNNVYTTTNLYIYDSLIAKLQTDSLMRNARLLYVLGGPDTSISLRSLKLEDTIATRSGTVTFTPYVGMQGSGVTNSNSFINTNIWASGSYGIFDYNQMSMGVLSRDTGQSDGYDFAAYSTAGGTSYTSMRIRETTVADRFQGDLASASYIGSTTTSAKGFFFINRPGSNDTIKFYKNGSKLGQVRSPKTVLTQYFLTIGGIRYLVPGGGGLSPRQYSAAWYGNTLNETQQTALYNHLTWYYNRVGQPIYPSVYAGAYYIDSASGNDANDGFTPETAWQTIGKLNSVTFTAGDTIKIKAPHIYETTSTINIKNASLENLVLTSYGTGKPTLSINNLDTLLSLTHSNATTPKIRVRVNNIIFKGPATNTVEYTGPAVDSVSRKIGFAYQVSDSTTWSATDSIRLYIKNCEFSGFIRGVQLCNWYFDKPIRYTLDSNLIYNCVESGLQVYGGFDSSKYRYNKVYNIFGTTREGNTYGMNLAFVRNAVTTRNLVYNIGAGTAGGIGIATMGGALNTFTYNEVYGVKKNTQDGHGIDLDNDMDSSIVEYNYIHNNDGAGVLISGLTVGAMTQFAPYAYGYNWKILASSGSDRNVVRYNLFKNNVRASAPNGNAVSFNCVNTHIGNMVYNNTSVLQNNAVTAEAMIAMTSSNGIDSTRIYNNTFIGSKVLMFNFRGQTSVATRIYNNIFWDSANAHYQWVKYNVNTTDSLESLGLDPNYWYNPQLKNPWTAFDTLNNVWALDTLSNYKKRSYYPSSITDFGVNVDSLYVYALTGLPTRGTTDYFGTVLPNNGRYDIGAYEDTSAFKWQDTTRLYIGQSTSVYTTTDLQIYDSLIYKLQVDSLMRNARLLYILGGPDASISLRSLKLEDTAATTSGTVTFTPYVGMQGNGTTGFINTNIWASSTNAVFDSTATSIGALIRDNYAGNVYDIGAYSTTLGTTYLTLESRHSLNRFRLDISSNNPGVNYEILADSSSKGFFLGNRIGSNDTVKFYKNGIFLKQAKITLVGLPRYFMTIGAIRYGVTGGSAFSPRQYAAMWYGNGLTYSQQYNLNEHLKWFYYRVGQPITAAPLPDASPLTLSANTNRSHILFTYTPVLKENDTLKMYYVELDSIGRETYYRIISTNSGTSWINATTIDLVTPGLARDAIIRDPSNAGIYRMLYHKLVSGSGWRIYPATSTDKGVTFTKQSDGISIYRQTPIDSTAIGEDVSLIYNTDSSLYYVYFRPYRSNDIPYPEMSFFRKIALRKTSTFTSYTNYYKIILPVDSTLFFKSTSKDYRKSFYNMTAFKTASNEWWGIVNTLTHDNYPTDSGKYGIVNNELIFSRDGQTWHRTNDTNAFIPRPTNINQLFMYGTVITDQVWFYGFAHKPKHGYEDLLNERFKVLRYRMTIADLRKYIPQGI